MNHYKLIVAYDGTDYAGWQSQGNGKSVAEALCRSFESVFRVQPFLHGVSRTDAGVHAVGQVVWLKADLDLDPDQLKFAWNNRIDRSIVIRSVQAVSREYRSMQEVIEKTYFYHFFTSRPLPFLARYGWYCDHRLDLDKLRGALQIFVGTHDFRSYCTGDEWEDTVRTINSIELVTLPKIQMYRIVVKGPRFLRYMIRRIVGSCIQVASHSKMEIGYLKKVLDELDPEQCLRNAPSRGLMLYRIKYLGDGFDDDKETQINLF